MRNASDASLCQGAGAILLSDCHIDLETRIKANESAHSLFIATDRRHRKTNTRKNGQRKTQRKKILK